MERAIFIRPSLQSTACWEHELTGGLNVRFELYDKRISDPWPRFLNHSGTIEFFPEVEEDRVRLQPRSAQARGVELFIKKTVAPS